MVLKHEPCNNCDMPFASISCELGRPCPGRPRGAEGNCQIQRVRASSRSWRRSNRRAATLRTPARLAIVIGPRQCSPPRRATARAHAVLSGQVRLLARPFVPNWQDTGPSGDSPATARPTKPEPGPKCPQPRRRVDAMSVGRVRTKRPPPRNLAWTPEPRSRNSLRDR